MNKKFYITPAMEETDLKIATYLQSMSGGDPTINPSWGGGVSDDDFPLPNDD